jgi:hypothetical protein
VTPGAAVAEDQAGMPGNEAGPGPASPSDLLGEMTALRRQARAARHGYWFPLLLFGLLACLSVPFYLQPAVAAAGGGPGAMVSANGAAGPPLPFLGGSSPLVSGYLGYYWIAALLGGLLLTLLWYWRHARRIGLQTPSRGYLVTTAIIVGLAIVIPPLSQVSSPHSLRFLHRLQVLWPGDLVVRGTFPFLIIAVGLLVLSWAERSRALAVTAVVYTGASLLASLYDVSNLTGRLGWNLPAGAQSLPNVLLPGLVLLIAGAGAFAMQRRRRATA